MAIHNTTTFNNEVPVPCEGATLERCIGTKYTANSVTVEAFVGVILRELRVSKRVLNAKERRAA